VTRTSSSKFDKLQSNEAIDVGLLLFLNPGSTKSVTGGVIPAKDIRLSYTLKQVCLGRSAR
jgi:hypothetical protein